MLLKKLIINKTPAKNRSIPSINLISISNHKNNEAIFTPFVPSRIDYNMKKSDR